LLKKTISENVELKAGRDNNNNVNGDKATAATTQRQLQELVVALK
jgi:hypothetical protein